MESYFLQPRGWESQGQETSGFSSQGQCPLALRVFGYLESPL